ncbi:hypothetical protein DM01DRAFT_1331354 [Hesseltinella vesiculosa]|uniref:Cyclin N-terminal domain-containing protein n=1 Tax=Hesseltinella vesiculosa TaxID=101127 RepID=A0A1X2GV12_9FUNG|nr:hypothetical protein DM01DRAFT_1331354 [Hesseltinella vesiculosa]
MTRLEKSWYGSLQPELLDVIADKVAHMITPHTVPDPDEYLILPLPTFIQQLIRRSKTQTGTLLIVMILLERLANRLGHRRQLIMGMSTAPQRIFLATLILSTKLFHDTSPKNIHWVSFANDLFHLHDINLMERQLLTLLDFQLTVSKDEFDQVVDQLKRLKFDSPVAPDPFWQSPKNICQKHDKPSSLDRPPWRHLTAVIHSSLSSSSSSSSVSSASSRCLSTPSSSHAWLYPSSPMSFVSRFMPKADATAFHLLDPSPLR